MSYTPHEWQNDELITAAKLNHIEEGIAEGGSGGDYDSYDFVFEKIGDSSPLSIIKGDHNSICSKLQNQEPVMGLYVFSSNVGPYNDVITAKVPLTYCQYYSSVDAIFANGLYVAGTLHLLFFTWQSDGLRLSEVLMPYD